MRLSVQEVSRVKKYVIYNCQNIGRMNKAKLLKGYFVRQVPLIYAQL